MTAGRVLCYEEQGRVKGRTLRLSRLRLGLRQQDVADAVGCSRARVGQVEQLRKVPRIWADRYRGALSVVGPSESMTMMKAVPVRPGAAKEAGRGATQHSD